MELERSKRQATILLSGFARAGRIGARRRPRQIGRPETEDGNREPGTENKEEETPQKRDQPSSRAKRGIQHPRLGAKARTLDPSLRSG